VSKQVAPQFRHATVEEIFAAQSTATKQVCPDFSQPQTASPVDPEQEYLRLREELSQLEFRISDSERRLESITSDLKDFEQEAKVKSDALASLPEIPGTLGARERLRTEIQELGTVIADVKSQREAMIRLVGSSKNILKKWHQVNGESFENFREITKLLDQARV